MTMGAAQLMQKYGITANVDHAARAHAHERGGPARRDVQEARERLRHFAPENVSPLVGWLASPLAANVSGHVLIVWGREITLIKAPKLEPTFSTEDHWTTEEVTSKLAPWFAEHRPITDGFTVSP